METRKPFPGYTFKGAKGGGANDSGPYGGIYASDKDNTLALIKRDSKGGKPRVGRVIGEAVTGAILNAIYDGIGVDRSRVAQVELVQVNNGGIETEDTSGENTYIKSIFIKNYVSDLWAYAYEAKFIKEYINENQAVFLASSKEGQKAIIKLATLYATEKVKNMQRPSGMFSSEVRNVINTALLENEDFIMQFAEIAVPRLLAGDFGLHNANFGLARIAAENTAGKLRLVALDYGAGLRNLPEEFNPFVRFGTGAEIHKNHFLEYDKRLIMSEMMAKKLIAAGQVPLNKIEKNLRVVLDDVCAKYSVDQIKHFCKRIGIEKNSYEKVCHKGFLIAHIKTYLLSRMKKRLESAVCLGHMLLVEHCIDENGKVNQGQFEVYISHGYQLDSFVENKAFEETNFILNRFGTLASGGIMVLGNLPFDWRIGYKETLKQELLGAKEWHRENTQGEADDNQNKGEKAKEQEIKEVKALGKEMDELLKELDIEEGWEAIDNRGKVPATSENNSSSLGSSFASFVSSWKFQIPKTTSEAQPKGLKTKSEKKPQPKEPPKKRGWF